MKKVLAKTTGLSKQDWLALRRRGIGGSDAAAACGLSRFVSPYALFMEKTSACPKKEAGKAAYWGTVMEPILREEFAKRTQLETVAVPYMFYSAEYPWMLANIDGIAKDKDGTVSLLEIKTAGLYAVKDWSDGLPPEYYIQIQHYLSVTELHHAYVAVLIGGNDFRILEVQRDDAAIEHIIALEAVFWTEHVLKHIAPPVDGTESTAAAIAALYPKGNQTDRILPAEADALAEHYLRLQTQEKDIKSQKTATENKLKALLGESECALTPTGYAVSWKNVSTTRLDSTRLKQDHPELVSQYIRTTQSRKFAVKPTAATKGEF